MVKRESKKEEFTQRLITACDGAKLTGRGRNKTLADGLKRQGITVSTPGVWKWFNAQALPDSTNIEAISKILGVRAEWLEYGIGSMTVGGEQQSSSVANIEYRVDVLDVEASAGTGNVVSSEVAQRVASVSFSKEEATTLFRKRPSESVKVITVTGDSMSGTIELGDYIFVDTDKNYFDGDGVYVFIFKGALLVKRLQMSADSISVLSDNPKYAPWDINEESEEHLKIIGRVLYCNSMRALG